MAKKKEDKCICDQCPRRFVCFTQKKVFSDPAYQAMYEAHIEEGKTHEEAVEAVRMFIERMKELETIPKTRKSPPWDDWRIGPVIKKEWNTDPGWYDTYKYKEIKSLPVDEAKKEIKELKNWVRYNNASKSS